MAIDIRANLNRMRETIERAAQTTGRKMEDIIVVAVTKTVPINRIQQAYEEGIRHFGENRIQEWQGKYEHFQVSELHWHLIGRLQSNKINKTLGRFALIQSIDRLDLVRALHERLEKNDQYQEILLEVKTSREDSKSGFEVEYLHNHCAELKSYNRLIIKGLMTIGENSDDERIVRSCFASLRALYQEIDRMKLFPMTYLSMGMSYDYPWAIAEGANMVRIGSAIFGER